MLLTLAQIKPQSFESRRNSFFFSPFFYRVWMRLIFTCVLGRLVASTVLSVPNLSEGADRVAGQLRGDKECPFSGVTKYGRVWRKVPESDARSVGKPVSCHVVGLLDVCAATMQIRISLDHNDQTQQGFRDTNSACRKRQ